MFPGYTERSHDILLVEDNAADARLALEALRGTHLSLRAHAARDGVEALTFLMREGSHAGAPRPDLVLLDLNLPKKDGCEVLREIRDHPDLRSIPVAILTTSRAPEDIARCYDMGANCVIAKPVEWDQFVRVIGRTISFWLVHSTLPTRKGTALRQNPLRVLLIEDNPGDARLVQEMLRDEADTSYALTTVTTLREGLERLKTEEFDTVLLDLSLPDGQAVETLGALRFHEGRRPIVVLTGIKDEVVAANAMRQGAEDFLVKGQIDGPSLARALRHALERSR
jgi:CheY-like chemotaxis protein